MLLVDAYPSGREEYNVSVQSQKNSFFVGVTKQRWNVFILKITEHDTLQQKVQSQINMFLINEFQSSNTC